jgi:SAM-dependent methyltransferase
MSADLAFSTWEETVAWLRAQPDQAELVIASYYDDPLPAAADRYYLSDEWRAIRELLLGRSGRALDVGAGRGIASYAFAREGFEVTALEPDPSNLVGAGAIRALATETGLPIGVVQDFSERLPFTDGEFDVVFARAVLHHTRDLDTACAELARVLKPGGLLVAVREHVISRKEDLPAFLESHPLHRYYGGENAFLLSQYRQALKLAGLQIERQVSPLASPINYSPQTRESLRREIVARARAIPGLGLLLSVVLRPEPMLSLALCVAGLIDRRPGRLYSFICRKPD